MTDRVRNTEEIEREAGARDIAQSDRGPVKDPDGAAAGESLINQSAEDAEPTI